MAQTSRFFAQKDIDTFDKFNKELVGDLYTSKDGVISQKVVIYKVSVYDTEVNMYGETASGKTYKPGVQVSALIEADDQTTTTDEFGPDLQQNALFSFLRQSLVDISYVVEIGDVVDWNQHFWEINSVTEPQLIAGHQGFRHNVNATAHRSRLSNLQIEERPR